MFCIACPNLVVLASIGGELCRRQAQNGVFFYIQVQFVLGGHGQSTLKTNGILTNVFYTSGPNLVLLTWTGDELPRGQAKGWHTDGRTDTRTHTHTQSQATTMSEGQNWPRVKTEAWKNCPTFGGRYFTNFLEGKSYSDSNLTELHS